MTAAEHAKVWNDAMMRLNTAAAAANLDKAYQEQTELLRLAVFAGMVGAAYRDSATVFKKD